MRRLAFPATVITACAVLAALAGGACSGGGSSTEAPAPGKEISPTGLTPSEVVVASGQGLGGVDSYRVRYSFTMDGMVEGEEAYQSQALVYSRLVANGGSEPLEVLLVPPDLYTRAPDGTWFVLSPWHQGIRPEQLSAIIGDDALGADDAFLDYARLTELVEDAEQVPDEIIDDEPFVRIAGTVDPSALWPDAPSAAVDVQLWLHRGNFLPRRVELGPIDGWPESPLIALEFLGYNEPVAAPERPDDAQPLRDFQLVDAPCTGEGLAKCLEAQGDLASIASDSCAGAGRRLCIAPLGRVSVPLVQHLVDYYRDEYGLAVSILTPLPVPAELINAQRGQVDGEALVEYMGTFFPAAYGDPDAVLIGLTPVDVYDPASYVRYYFGMRRDFFDPKAVLSTFRMDPAIYGEAQDDPLFNSRVRKLLTKYLGLLYYDLPLSSDPRSPMFDSIGGPADLDRMQEPLTLPPATE